MVTDETERESVSGGHVHSSARRKPKDSSGSSESLYAQLGEARLREIIDVFVDRIFDDMMIGFFFRHADRNRIKEMEFQFTAEFLGADIEYQGRPLAEAHRKHPIMGGQFARRLQILRDTLEEYRVPPHIREAWLEHTESLRPLITGDQGSDCDPMLARDRVTKS